MSTQNGNGVDEPGQPPLGRNVLEWGSNKVNAILAFCCLNWYEWHVPVLPGLLEEVYRHEVLQYRDSGVHMAMLKSMQVIWR